MPRNNFLDQFMRLKNLSLKTKRVIIIGNDFFSALICWLVFGPPMATFIASEFSTGIFIILFSEWFSFLVPTLISLSYLYLFGFYRSVIKFFDSKDSIFLSLSGFFNFWFFLVNNLYQSISNCFYIFFIDRNASRFFISSSFLCILESDAGHSKVHFYHILKNKEKILLFMVH